MLAIDCTGPRLQLALVGPEVEEIIVLDLARGHAEILFEQIETLLDRATTTYGQLTRIAVTSGPGSFTGVRIGLAAARGLGLALGIDVIGVPTLLAMSLSTAHGGLTVLDARRGEAYVQQFIGPGVPEGEARVMPMLEARALMAGDESATKDCAVDIARLAHFARDCDPSSFPPHPTYIRVADAKPQTHGRIARSEIEGTA